MIESDFDNPFASPHGDASTPGGELVPFRSAIILLWILAGFVAGFLLAAGAIVWNVFDVKNAFGAALDGNLALSVLLWSGFAGGAGGAAAAKWRLAPIVGRAEAAAENRRRLEFALEAAKARRTAGDDGEMRP